MGKLFTRQMMSKNRFQRTRRATYGSPRVSNSLIAEIAHFPFRAEAPSLAQNAVALGRGIPHVVHGLMMDTPAALYGAVSREATMKPREAAIAAM